MLKNLLKKINRPLSKRYPQYRFGKETYSNDLEVFSWNEGASLEIGAFTSIAPGVKIYLGGEHRTDWVTTFPFSYLWKEAMAIQGHPRTKGNVKIGNDVWIGTEAIIMSGVTIGDGAVIGARAVVTKSVADYVIIAGNPATEIKRRFDDETISQLKSIKWWLWSDTKIKEALPLLLNDNIDQFIKFSMDSK